MKKLALVCFLAGCGGSTDEGGSKSISDGTYDLDQFICASGNLTASGTSQNTLVSSGALIQTAIISGSNLILVSTYATSATNYCQLELDGTFAYTSDTILSITLPSGNWIKTGTITCPANYTTATHAYDYVLSSNGDVGIVARDTTDANFPQSYCTAGLPGRIFLKQ